MISLNRYFAKYTGLLRRLKLSYVINNLLNSNRLQHNKQLYKRYGLRKSIYSPIGSKDVLQLSEEGPWLDQADALEAMQASSQFQELPIQWQEQLRCFVQEGFMVLKGFYNVEEIIQINSAVEDLIGKGKVDFNYTARKIMDAHQDSPVVDSFFRNPRLLDLLSFILGKSIIPFQTINFIEGSEQRAHSDSIHMTTAPQGYMIAAWTALEDTHSGNGPLLYYPGSHRLPYVTTQDYPSGNSTFLIGGESNKRYEDKIQAIIEENNWKPSYFHAQKGDVFIWHANLLHGGSAIKQSGTTRKSMVAHYFAKDVICYHEISQRPALLKGAF